MFKYYATIKILLFQKMIKCLFYKYKQFGRETDLDLIHEPSLTSHAILVKILNFLKYFSPHLKYK